MSGCDRDERRMGFCGWETWCSRSVRPRPLLIDGCPWQRVDGNGCCLSLEWIVRLQLPWVLEAGMKKNYAESE